MKGQIEGLLFMIFITKIDTKEVGKITVQEIFQVNHSIE